MTHVINGKCYEDAEIFKAVQRDLKCEGDLMGNYTHVFRTCLQWQEKTKGIPYRHFKQPERDYHDYTLSGVLPEHTFRYFLEVVEPALRGQKKESA